MAENNPFGSGYGVPADTDWSNMGPSISMPDGSPNPYIMSPEDRRYYEQDQRQQEQIDYARERDAMFDMQQQQREARIREAMGSVQSLFAGRGGMYTDYANDTFDLSKFALDDEQALNSRQLMFSLARNGLTGGSTDIDKGVDLGNKYAFGLQTARSHADAAGDQLRSTDQGLKTSLLGLAATGAIGGSQMGSIGADSLSGINTTPSSMQNMGQFYQGLYDKIGSAGNVPQGQSGGNPYAAGGGSSTYRPASGGASYGGTVS